MKPTSLLFVLCTISTSAFAVVSVHISPVHVTPHVAAPHAAPVVVAPKPIIIPKPVIVVKPTVKPVGKGVITPEHNTIRPLPIAPVTNPALFIHSHNRCSSEVLRRCNEEDQRRCNCKK